MERLWNLLPHRCCRVRRAVWHIVAALTKTERVMFVVARVLVDLQVRWKDLFVESIREMRKTDLIEHRIPTYADAIPKISKPMLYTGEEIKWQPKHIPEMIEAGIITQCDSPWAARTRFPRKASGNLRMVHAFIPINDATIAWYATSGDLKTKFALWSSFGFVVPWYLISTALAFTLTLVIAVG